MLFKGTEKSLPISWTSNINRIILQTRISRMIEINSCICCMSQTIQILDHPGHFLSLFTVFFTGMVKNKYGL